MYRTTHILCAVAIVATGTPATGAESIVLKDELSRSELARYAMSKDAVRAIPRRFEFPKHAVDGKFFGIDVSHHQGTIQWNKVVGQGVRFAYVKATQGSKYHDGQFANNWTALKNLGQASPPVLRGAYHFLSAVDAPEAQAANYIAKIGRLEARDLPPCLDLEWDLLRKNGKFVKDAKGNFIDQWSKLGSAEIVRRAKVWLAEVERATGKKPVIYTSAAWWAERVGKDVELADYPLWVADYTSNSLNQEKPRVPRNFNWVMWQLTDLGMLSEAGLTKGLDTNVLQSTDSDFASVFRQSEP